MSHDTKWNCPFPPAADEARIDVAIVTLLVAVTPDGTPESVRIVKDLGFDFGTMAAACAMKARYVPARDVAGHPVAATTPPIRIRFARMNLD